jgi:hypothetical protein
VGAIKVTEVEAKFSKAQIIDGDINSLHPGLLCRRPVIRQSEKKDEETKKPNW